MYTLLERMDRVNNTRIQQLESLNPSIEAMTRTVVEKYTQEPQIYTKATMTKKKLKSIKKNLDVR